jgi:hypothetical protein
MTIPMARRSAAASLTLLAAAFLIACDSGTSVEPLAVQYGRNAAADACLNGGYTNLVRSDGSPFKKAGDCVSYVTRGGTFGPFIVSFELNANGCDEANYTAVFTGGTGVVAGNTITSGVAFTLGVYTVPTLVVTAPDGATATATAPLPYIESWCLL